MVGEIAECVGDFLVAFEPEKADGGVAKGSEVLRGVAGLHLVLVFAEGDVADPVEPILDSPVIASAGQKNRRVGARSCDAGDRELHLDRLLAAVGGRPLEPADLFQAGPVEMLGQARAGRQTPRDGPPVALLDGTGFRQRLLALLLGREGKIPAETPPR